MSINPLIAGTVSLAAVALVAYIIYVIKSGICLIRCSWCGKYLGLKLGIWGVSHGMCRDCNNEQMNKARLLRRG